MSMSLSNPLDQFTKQVSDLLATQAHSQRDSIEAAASHFADVICADKLIHTFGTGHSHILAEEIFYRAGGLANVSVVVDDELMLHKAVVSATNKERESATVSNLLASHPMVSGDCLLVISNSGGNGATLELAKKAKELGVKVIALTSVNHASSAKTRSPQGVRLHEIADVVLDNGGVPGDASISFDGLATPVAATSTIIGAFLLQSVVVETVARVLASGRKPELFLSANLDGGDAHNKALFAKYVKQIPILN